MQKKRLFMLTICMLGCLLLGDHSTIAQDNKVVFATDPWEPFYGPDQKNGGFLTEIVQEAFRRVGYTCEVQFMPWNRALEYAKQGQYDGLLGAFFTEERTQFFVYSEPIAESKMVFFAKKGANIHYMALQELAPYKIGTVRGYHYTDEFDAATYLQKIEATHTENNIKLMLIGRIDLLVEAEKVVLYLLQHKFPEALDALEVVQPPLQTNKLYVTFSKQAANYEQKAQVFNRGLQMIQADGTYAQILKEHGF